MIKDTSQIAKLTVWEEHVHKLEFGKTYNLREIMVREFNGTKYILTSIEGSLIEEVADIGITNNADDTLQINKTVENVSVVAVIYLENQKKCLKCSSKLPVQETDLEVVKCSKCSIWQLYSACESSVSSKLMIKSPQTHTPLTLLVFNDLVREIVEQPMDLTSTSQVLLPCRIEMELFVPLIVTADQVRPYCHELNSAIIYQSAHHYIISYFWTETKIISICDYQPNFYYYALLLLNFWTETKIISICDYQPNFYYYTYLIFGWKQNSFRSVIINPNFFYYTLMFTVCLTLPYKEKQCGFMHAI